MLKLFILISLFVYSCTPSPRYASQNIKKDNNASKSKKVKTIPVKPAPKDFDKSKTIFKGVSSYYGKDFHGKLTANGEIFDMYGVTAAHKKLPFNTYVRVTNENNNKNLLIRINDRGPYVGDRILDCSYGAAKKLGFVNEGIAPVKVEVVEWGDGEYMHHK